VVERKDETKPQDHGDDVRHRRAGGDGDDRPSEEYTAYRETDPSAPEDPEADREADLQPGKPDAEPGGGS
jgi:hypothetical protein